MKHLVKNWQRLTNDPMIPDMVNGYEIPFILPPRQLRLPYLCQFPKKASDLVNQEVQDMLRKDVIVVTDPKEDQFLSSLFLVKKKDGGNRPVVNVMDLNRNIPYQHFKMEGLFLLKEMLLPGDKVCKIDLTDAYFAIPLPVKSRKYVRFQWKGLLYELCCLCFGLSPAPLVFTVILKVPISLLRKLNLRIIIYLDDMRYTDIHTSTLRFSDQYQKVLPRANIDFRISRGDSRF